MNKTRYWISWWSGFYKDEGCTQPPFQTWITGERERSDGRTELSFCAVIDAEDDEVIWKGIKEYFPDYEERFIHERPLDWTLGDRFPGFEGRTSLKGAADE